MTLYEKAFESQDECTSENLDIIDKDVKRSLFEMYPDKHILKTKQNSLKQQLISFYAKNKELKYYQGMNDVSGFLLSYFDTITALSILSGVEKKILRDYSSLKFEISVIPQFDVMKSIIIYHTNKLKDYEDVLMTLIQFVSVSWNLTLFSHDIPKHDKNLVRIWDFLVSVQPNMIQFQISSVIFLF